MWDILSDFEKYPEWNPFTYKVEGILQIGQKVDLYVQMKAGDQRVQSEEVCAVKKPKHMAWKMQMGSSLILAARRDQFIEVIDDKSCSYETIDAFQGLLTPVVMGLFKKHIENGFNKLAEALKKRAES